MSNEWETHISIQLSEYENKARIATSIIRDMIVFAKTQYVVGAYKEETGDEETYDNNDILDVIHQRINIFDTLYGKSHEGCAEYMETIPDILKYLSVQKYEHLDTLQFIVADMLISDTLFPKIIEFLNTRPSKQQVREYYDCMIGG